MGKDKDNRACGARMVALDGKERLDIVRGNRRVGATSTFEAREARRGGFGEFTIMRR
jgi:hypothetical protein